MPQAGSIKCSHGDSTVHAYSVASVMSDSLQPPPWTIVLQVPLSMGFSRKDYWSGLPGPPNQCIGAL